MKSAQKPQDIVILLKVHCLNSMWTYDDLAKSLKTSDSVVYEALQRCEQCHLYNSKRRKVLKSAVEEYLIHGLKYVQPILGLWYGVRIFVAIHKSPDCSIQKLLWRLETRPNSWKGCLTL